MTQLTPRESPCPTCPYRKNCPAGVWHSSEYVKLAEYDKPTGEQPLGVFMCHDAKDGSTMCRGWLDTHDKDESLALRFAVMTGKVEPEIFDLPVSGEPVFASGTEAAQHGMAAISDPPPAAVKVIKKLMKQRAKGV